MRITVTIPPTQTIRVIDASSPTCPELPLVEGKGNVKVVLWPGNGAQYRSIQVFTLERGDRTVPLRHKTDCVYGIIAGSGTIVDVGASTRHDLIEGTMLHIDADDTYRVEAGENGITFLGGPCPPDEALYASIQHLRSAGK